MSTSTQLTPNRKLPKQMHDFTTCFKSQMPKAVSTYKPINIARLVDLHVPKSSMDLNVFSELSNYNTFAKQIFNFAIANVPNAVKSLSYDPTKNTVIDLIIDLTDALFDADFFFDIIDDSLTLAFSSVPFNCHLYTIDANHINSLPNTPLKIGFAHLLGKMSKGVVNSILEHQRIDSLSNSHLEYVIDMKDEFPVPMLKAHLKTINKTLKNFHKYIGCDLNDFKNYSPKSDRNKTLKSMIEKGLSLDFILIYRFADDQNRHEGLPFNRCFQMVFDFNHPLEQAELDYDIDCGQGNGVSLPCKYYSLYDSHFKEEISEEDVKQLSVLADFFYDSFNILNQ